MIINQLLCNRGIPDKDEIIGHINKADRKTLPSFIKICLFINTNFRHLNITNFNEINIY